MDLTSPDRFKDSDKEKVTAFLNFVAKKAVFTMDTKETIEYYGLLSYCQQVLLKKIDSHIMGEIKVHEPVKETKPARRRSKAKSKAS